MTAAGGKIPGTNLTREDIQVVALNLQDATEDLNDALREAEAALVASGYPAAAVLVPPFTERPIGSARLGVISTDILVWDGQELFYVVGKACSPVLECSRAARIRAANAFQALVLALGVPDGRVERLEAVRRP